MMRGDRIQVGDTVRPIRRSDLRDPTIQGKYFVVDRIDDDGAATMVWKNGRNKTIITAYVWECVLIKPWPENL
jgi:hypothetical protein